MALPNPITTKPATYFYQVNAEGQRPPVSKLEISGLFYPEYLGRVVAEDMDEGSLIAQLMLQQRESTVSNDQIVWKEEDGSYSVNKVVGAGLVIRALDDFTINAAAIPTDAYDIDDNRPTQAQWIVKEGMNFMVVDALGEVNHGVITAIATDGKTFTATPIGDGVSAWTVGTTNLDVIFYGYNLDHCECPPCIGYKNYTPTRENTMFKDGQCVEYCEETLAVEGSGATDLFEKDGQFMSVDQRLTDAQKALLERMEFAMAFGKRLTPTQAAALGQKSLGMNGIFTTLENRALKVQGEIETIDDLVLLAGELKRQGVKSATLRTTNSQYAKLMALVTPTSPYYVNPFEDNTNSLFYIGFRGVNINGITIIFKEWSALDALSENLAKKYHYVVIPEGVLTKHLNGQAQKVGYLQLVWFNAFGKVYKFLRDKENEEKNCGSTKVDYISKFTIALFHPEKWILGVV